ncbi:MAG: type II secretion system protein GspM [Hydrogenophaga sp.]|uniref:type II secretion system protein GspM n=1 Tax=Hydrogenophaga sp. TaxID=1904254 RepID=UPI003D9AFC9D
MTDRTPSPLQRLRQTVQPAWARLAPRERLAVGAAATVVGLALLWWLGVAPALTTLRAAPAQHQQLDAQLAQMRQMAATAQSLRGQNQALAPASARSALEQATSTTLAGTAQLQVQGDRATVTLRGTPPDALAQWLAQVRINARVVPVQADLQRSAAPAGWSGQLVLAGPGLGAGN